MWLEHWETCISSSEHTVWTQNPLLQLPLLLTRLILRADSTLPATLTADTELKTERQNCTHKLHSTWAAFYQPGPLLSWVSMLLGDIPSVLQSSPPTSPPLQLSPHLLAIQLLIPGDTEQCQEQQGTEKFRLCCCHSFTFIAKFVKDTIGGQSSPPHC